MKLTVLLICLACLGASATGNAQITLREKEANLSKCFKEIQRQSGYDIFYRVDQVERAGKITVDLNNVSLEEAMRAVLKGTKLDYSIEDRTVIIKEKEVKIAITPPIDVKGKVMNEKGEPVEGVSVQVKPDGKTISTDKNGVFSLTSIDADAILFFSHVAMESLELKVGGKTELQVNMKTKISALGEIQVTVNTGYQRIKSQNFVGSYSQMDSASFHRRAGMDIVSRLDGTITSMLFDKKGDNRYPFQIRGISTLTGTSQSASTEPLIIVDNFPFKQGLNAINPFDIENVTVYKDAAATSIWGAQAGNGVIVITTKKGKYNQPLRITVNSNLTIRNKPDPYAYPQMSVNDFIDAEIFLFNNGRYDANLGNTNIWPAISPVVEVLNARRNGSLSAMDSAIQIDGFRSRDVRRDLDKYAYRSALSQQHFMNVSGGNQLLKYKLSGGYNRSLNNVRHSQPDDQFIINTSASFRPFNKMEISGDVNYSQSTTRSATLSLPNLYPYAQLRDEQGTSLAVPTNRLAYLDTVGGGQLLDWRYRPLDEPGFSDRKDLTRFILINLGLNYEITKWLNASLAYQYTNQSENRWVHYSLQSYYARSLINQYSNLSETDPNLRHPVPVGGILDMMSINSGSRNARGQLNFNKSFKGRHNIVALLSAEISETKIDGSQQRLYGFDKEKGTSQSAIDYITSFPLYGRTESSAVTNNNKLLTEFKRRFVSFLGNISYTFNDRYSLYASARKDGSNIFGVNTNKKWKPLWSVGGSWTISKEQFFSSEWISQLRIRSSFGYTGNPGDGSGRPTIIFGRNPADYTNLIFAFSQDPPNPDLRWEKVRILNVGVEFGVLKGRISGSVDVWEKKSTDIISNAPVPPSTGNLSFITNTANLKGNGFDINITTRNIDGGFKWETRFGFSHVKTIVTKLHNSRPSGYYSIQDFLAYGLNAAQGQMAFGVYSYRWAGLDPLTGDPRGYLTKQISKNYAAISTDSIGNQRFHGSSIPLNFGFVNNSFSWKRFTFSMNIVFRLNFYFRKPTINYTSLAQAWQGNADYALRWKQPGDEAFTNVPSFTYPLNSARDAFFQLSEVNVLRGDNVRLQDARLQYDWINKKAKNGSLQGLQFFLYANDLNIILWRKNKSGLDPDFVGGTEFIPPTPKSWTAGVSLNF